MGGRGMRAQAGAPGGGGGALGATAGGGADLAVMREIWPVFESRVSVLARAGVGTVCSTEKLAGEFSLMTVRGPSPCELKVSMVSGLGVAPSQPTPVGRSVRMCPSVAERITMLWLSRQAAKRMLFLASSARPAQPPPLLETSYLPVIFMVLASMTAMAALSSIST